MKKILSFILTLALSISALCLPAFAEGASFNDVHESDWFYNAVTSVADTGIVVGTGNGKFSPNMQVTKLQFITMVARCRFSDYMNTIAKDKEGFYSSAHPEYFGTWYSLPFGVMKEQGALDALNLTSQDMDYLQHGDDSPCTRDEMVAILDYVMKEESDSDVNYTVENLPSDIIPDLGTCKYTNSVKRAVALGIINGVDSKGTFNPNGIMTRAQAAQVIYKLLNGGSRTHISRDVIDKQKELEKIKEMSSDVQSYLGKSYTEYGINPNAIFDTLSSTVNNLVGKYCIINTSDIKGTNGLYVSPNTATDTVICNFKADTIEYYSTQFKRTSSVKYKAIGNNIIAIDDITQKDWIMESDGHLVPLMDDISYVKYMSYAISGNKLYIQLVDTPIPEANKTSGFNPVETFELVDEAYANSLKSGNFDFTKAIGKWSYYSYTSSGDAQLTIDEAGINIGGKLYTCKHIGGENFEISSDSGKANYIIWMTTTTGGARKLLMIKLDSNNVADDVTGLFTEMDTISYITDGYVKMLYEVIPPQTYSDY